MARGNNVNPTSLQITANQLYLQGWAFVNGQANPDSEATQLDFIVPSTFSTGTSRVVIHFVTGYEGATIDTGDALFNLQTQFVPPNTAPPSNTITASFTSVTSPSPQNVLSASSSNTYNHYAIAYTTGTVNPDDHIFLNITRDYTAGGSADPYANNHTLYLIEIEFS